MFGYIYKLTNLINGTIYIGKHKYDKPELDPKYITSGVVVNKAIKKYGIENFKKELIAIAETAEDLNILEKFYIKEFDSYNSGYNLTEGGDGISNPSFEIIEINRIKHTGKKQSEETKNKRNKKLREIAHSDGWSQKISDALKGQRPSELTLIASSKRHKNTKWYNDGIKSYMLFEKDPLIEQNNLVPGRLKFNHARGFKKTDEQKYKAGNGSRGTTWYNNGSISKMFKKDELIPEGFVKGRLKFR